MAFHSPSSSSTPSTSSSPKLSAVLTRKNLMNGQVIKRVLFAVILVVIVILSIRHPTFPRTIHTHSAGTVHTHNAKGISALDLWRIKGPDAQKKLGQLFDGEIVDDASDEYAHQKSFHIPLDPIAARHCPEAWLLQDLANDAAPTITEDPLIYHFHNGSYIDNQENEFPVGTEFCSVILAPQPPHEESGAYAFHNQAIEGWGPDSIHCEINSSDIRLIPQHPDYFGALTITKSGGSLGDQKSLHSKKHVIHRTVLAVYTIPYVLNHPGVYQFNGEVEFQSYDWVMEDPIDVAHEQHDYYMIENSLDPRSPAINITGKPVPRPQQKCYFNGFNDLQGRWYRAEAFTREGSQTKLNPLAHLEFAEHNNTVDEWGWTFAPDACSLTYFTPQDHETCLANRTVQVLGDSNSRRLMKSIVGGGRGWCTDPHDRICQCEDTWEESISDMNWAPVDTFGFRNTEDREMPMSFGKNSSVYFDFVGGLLNAKIFNPWGFFFDRPIDPLAPPTPEPPADEPDDANLNPAEPHHPPLQASLVDRRLQNSSIDIVHVSLLGWDIAALRTPSQVLAALPTFRNTLLRTYPPGTRFITRLANSMCCGNQNHRTRYSAPRFRMWNAMWRRFWSKDELADNIRVDDASVLQGRRDAETAYFCPTTHLRGSHIRLEQMMWMSAVCEKKVAVGSRAMGEDAREGELTVREWGWSREDVMMAGPGVNEVKFEDKKD